MLVYDSYARDSLEGVLDKEHENVKALKKKIEVVHGLDGQDVIDWDKVTAINEKLSKV